MGLKLKFGSRSNQIPDGEYNAKVTDIRATTVFKKQVIEFAFEIADGPHTGVALKAFANAGYDSFSSHTKLAKWASVVTQDTDPGEELDTDVFLAKLLRVRVETKESRRTKNIFSNVTDILGMVAEL